MSEAILQKPLLPLLLRLAIPTSVSIAMTLLFQLVDSLFIAQLGSRSLAAISYFYPVYLFLFGLFSGLISAITSVLAKIYGEQNHAHACQLSSIFLLLFSCIAFVVGLIAFYAQFTLFRALGANPDMVRLISDYADIVFLGWFVLVVMLSANAILMSKGNVVAASILMGISGLVNLVLDYVLIFGLGPIPACGLAGAAWATVIAWLVGSLGLFWLLLRRKLLNFRFQFYSMKHIESVKQLFRLGVPAAVTQILNPLILSILTGLIAQYGDDAVAAFGMVMRVESFGFAIVFAFSVILTPVVAQNFGAGQRARAISALKMSQGATTAWTIILFILLLMCSSSIFSLFTSKPSVLVSAEDYIWIVGLSYPLYALSILITSFFNGLHQPKTAFCIQFIRSFMLLLALILVGSQFELSAIWLAIALTNIFSGIWAIAAQVRYTKLQVSQGS